LGISDAQLKLLAYYYLGRCLEREGEDEAAAIAYAAMQRNAKALPDLKRDSQSVASYPALSLLKKDIAAIEKRMRPAP
jgi:hypothetical protein